MPGDADNCPQATAIPSAKRRLARVSLIACSACRRRVAQRILGLRCRGCDPYRPASRSGRHQPPCASTGRTRFPGTARRCLAAAALAASTIPSARSAAVNTLSPLFAPGWASIEHLACHGQGGENARRRRGTASNAASKLLSLHPRGNGRQCGRELCSIRYRRPAPCRPAAALAADLLGDVV